MDAAAAQEGMATSTARREWRPAPPGTASATRHRGGGSIIRGGQASVLETSLATQVSGDARTFMPRPQSEMSNGTNTSYESMHAAGDGGVQGQYGGQPMGSGSTGASTTQGLDASRDPVRVSGIPHGPDVWRGRVRVRWPSYRADAAVRAQVHRQPGEPLGVEPLHPGL